MGNRLSRSAILLWLATIGGCDATINRSRGSGRLLTNFEMDRVTAGSAVTANNAAAHGFGSAPNAVALGITSANSSTNPISAPLFDYANSQVTASASGGNLAQTGIWSQISLEGPKGGASVDAKAAGTGTRQAQVTAQFYGVGTNRADLAFGSVTAIACCGSDAAARVEVDSRADGPYTQELRGTPTSDIPGQVQSKVDIAVVSSALPLLDPAQVLVTVGSARASPKY